MIQQLLEMNDRIVPRALALCGALWCVAGIGAGLMRPAENNAPAARAESAVMVVEEQAAPARKTDRLPLPVDLKVNPPAPSPSSVPSTGDSVAGNLHAPAGVREEKPATHHRRAEVTCKHGKRWFWRGHHHSWRCRR